MFGAERLDANFFVLVDEPRCLDIMRYRSPTGVVCGSTNTVVDVEFLGIQQVAH
jgi:hypothetical protein